MKSLSLLLFLFSSFIFANPEISQHPVEVWSEPVPEWGIAIGVRTASIPYQAAEEGTVSDFVPKMYYEGDYLFLRGEYGGFRFFDRGWFATVG